jgi:hypothetical protein
MDERAFFLLLLEFSQIYPFVWGIDEFSRCHTRLKSREDELCKHLISSQRGRLPLKEELSLKTPLFQEESRDEINLWVEKFIPASARRVYPLTQKFSFTVFFWKDTKVTKSVMRHSLQSRSWWYFMRDFHYLLSRFRLSSCLNEKVPLFSSFIIIWFE